MKTKILAIALLLFTMESCKKESQTCGDGIMNDGETDIDCGGSCTPCPTLSARESVIQDYNTTYLETEISDCGWTGNPTGCIPGTLPQSTHDKVIKRINYFRHLVGLNDNTTLDPSQFAKYQQTALIMKINGLNHFPPNTWTCWTQTGSDGAATSNLSNGAHSTGSVTSFMRDNGSNNTAVGHRRWILHSEKTQFSYGSTNSSMALGVMQVAGGNTEMPQFIAYPPKGFIPQALVFARWSFGLPLGDFTSANVTMTGPTGNIPLTVVSRIANGYGDNTLVWEPSGIVTNSVDDVTYTVNITGVQNSTLAAYTYTVTIVKP